MMKTHLTKIIFFVSAMMILTGMSSCEDNLEDSREEAAIILDRDLKQIKDLADTNCDNAADLKAIPVGAKACGGPQTFVMYSVKIDTAQLFRRVKEYTQKQKEYNEKFNIVSDCALVTLPKSITCENGKPKAGY